MPISKRGVSNNGFDQRVLAKIINGNDPIEVTIAGGSGEGTVEVVQPTAGDLNMTEVNSSFIRTATELAANLLKTSPVAWGETYVSPVDFTATYTSSTSITLSGSPFTIDDANCYVFKILYKPTGGNWTALINAHNGVSIAASSNVLTITGAGTPFLSGDTYRVIVFGPEKAYDLSTDTEKNSIMNPSYSRNTDPEPIIAAAQTLTTSYADVGYEIENKGYKKMGIWIKVTKNDATAIDLQVIVKHTSAGTEEYNMIAEVIAAGVSTVSVKNFTLPAANNLLYIPIELDNAIPFVQIQAKDTSAGAHATIDTCLITKGY